MILLDAVRARLGPEAIRTGVAVDGFRDTAGGIEVDLADRAGGRSLGTAQGSLLIAADGIHSRARALLYPDEGPPAWGGIVMWRGVSSGPRFLTGRTMAMAGCKGASSSATRSPTRRGPLDHQLDLRSAVSEDYLWNREDWNRPGGWRISCRASGTGSSTGWMSPR